MLLKNRKREIKNESHWHEYPKLESIISFHWKYESFYLQYKKHPSQPIVQLYDVTKRHLVVRLIGQYFLTAIQTLYYGYTRVLVGIKYCPV